MHRAVRTPPFFTLTVALLMRQSITTHEDLRWIVRFSGFEHGQHNLEKFFPYTDEGLFLYLALGELPVIEGSHFWVMF